MRGSDPSYSGPTSLEHRLGLILVAFLAIAAISPVFVVEFPAIPDYPNYLSRLYLLAANGSPQTNPFYEVVRSPIPNLAFDLLVPLLAPLVGVPYATKVTFVMSECLVITGAMAVEWSFKGRHEISGFAALAVLYSIPFAVGLLNFEFGVGLALWGVAVWLFLRDRSLVLGYIGHCIVVCGLFASHFFAFGIYGLTIGILEAHAIRCRGGIGRANLLYLSLLASPLVVLLVLMKVAGEAPIPGGAGGTEWLMTQKVLWVVFFVNGYSAALSGCSMMAMIALIMFLRARKAINLTSAGIWIGLGFLITFVIMPTRLSGSYYVDVRMVLAAALIIPSFIYLAKATNRLARWSVVAALAVIAVVGTVSTFLVWLEYQRHYVQMVASFDRLEKFSYVLVGRQDNASTVGLIGDPFRHAPTLAAAYKGALVPSLFAIRGAQPIKLRDMYQEYDAVEAGLYDPVPVSILGAAARGQISDQAPRAIGRWPESFDYLYLLGSDLSNPFPAILTRITAGDRFVLYRVRKPIADR